MKKKENRIFAIGIIIALIYQLYYLWKATCNVPLMDYWHYINMFVEKMYTGNLNILDIWQNDGIHRSPLQFIYFLLNVKFFHLNVQVEIFGGALLMGLTCIMLYYRLMKECNSNDWRIRGGIGIAILIAVYNANQYELLTEEFALSFASRMILFLLSFLCTSNYLEERNEWKYAIGLGSLYIVTIISVGSGYFPAYVAIILFVILWNICETKGEKIKQSLFLVLCLMIGTLIYLNGMFDVVSVTSAQSIGVIQFMKNYMIGVIAMLGVSIIGGDCAQNITLLAGVIVFSIYLCSAILYIKRKYYKITYVPMLLYGYAVCAMGLIYMGRMDVYGLHYAFASRYVCETNVAFIGFIWIGAIYLADNSDNGLFNKQKAIYLICVTILAVGVLISDYQQWKIAPYRKIYGEKLIEGMSHIEDLSDEDFQAYQDGREQVINAVQVMEKYKLGIYRSK